MRTVWSVLLLCSLSLAQTIYRGNGRWTGMAALAPVAAEESGWDGVSYDARTDQCVIGYDAGDHTNCINGATTGQNGSALVFRSRDTDPLPFANLAPMNSDGYDPDFGSYMAMVTDTALVTQLGWAQTNNLKTSDGGGAKLMSRDQKMFMISNNGGQSALIFINPDRFFAHQCASYYDSLWAGSPAWQRSCFTFQPVGADHGLQTAGTEDSTHFDANGSYEFSLNTSDQPNILYESFDSNLGIYKDTICPDATSYPGCSGQSTYPIILRTVYVDFTSDTPVACSVLPADYRSMWGGMSLANDDSVGLNNLGAGDWHATTTYTAGESFILPNWVNCGTAGHCRGFVAQSCTGDCKSGTTKPDFVTLAPSEGNTYTETTGTGSITWQNVGKWNGQGPGFDSLAYSPGHGCTRWNTRNGKVYRGTGNAWPAGQTQTDAWMSCARSQNNFINPTVPCSFPDKFLLHGSGIGMNGATITATPTGGGGVQDDSILSSGDYSCRSQNGSIQWQCYHYILDLSSLMVHMCIDGAPDNLSHCAGHTIRGYNYFYADKQQYKHLIAKPNNDDGSPNPGYVTVPSVLPGDHHGSNQNQNVNDTAPMFLAQTDIPMTGRQIGDYVAANGSTPGNYGAYTQAWHNEEISVMPQGAQNWPDLCPSPATPCYKIQRFAHSFNTSNSRFFDTSNGMGFIDPSGKMFTWTTDMMGTRGSNSADRVAGHAYDPGDTVNPRTNNANHSTYQWQGGAAATSYSGTAPNWSLAQNVNDVICDDGTNRVNPAGGCGAGVLAWTNQNAPCNKMRADTTPADSTGYSLGQRVLSISGIAAYDIFEITSVVSGNSCVSGSTAKWGRCSNDSSIQCNAKADCGGNACNPLYGATVTDGTCTWTNKGQNDCSSAIVMLDTRSAHH